MQLTINFDCEPGARRSDPATSHSAAQQAKAMAARHHRIILACLKSHGPSGKDRIATLTSLTGVAVCRRLTELERTKQIRTTGRTVSSTAGRQEREWELM